MRPVAYLALVVVAACAEARHGEQKDIKMTSGTGSRSSSFARPPLTSAELVGAVVVRCRATPRAEHPVGAVAPGEVAGLFQRDFELAGCAEAHGQPPAAAATVTGYTTLAPDRRVDESTEPTLELDGQRLFDRPDTGAIDVVVVVGGPPVVAARGFGGKVATATWSGGKGDAGPARVFALAGVDRGLAEAIGALVGWAPARSIATARAAADAAHPLVAIDALRLAVADQADDQIALLAEACLHPGHASAVRVTAIELLGAAIAAAPVGSPPADRLIGVALNGWEQERRASVDTAYLTALTAAAPQLRGSSARTRAGAIPDDHQVRNLSALLDGLAAALK